MHIGALCGKAGGGTNGACRGACAAWCREEEGREEEPNEQAGIARALDAVDSALERTRAAVEQARQLERSLLEYPFDKLAAKRRRLGTFAVDVRYGTSKASSERGWGNPVLRIPNVVGNRLSLDDLAQLNWQRLT